MRIHPDNVIKLCLDSEVAAWYFCYLASLFSDQNKISLKSEIQGNDAHNNTLCYMHEALNNSRICVGIINV